MTKNIAEFDMESWRITEIDMKTEFFLFASTVYLLNNEIMVIGGLNNAIEDKPSFSDHVIKITCNNDGTHTENEYNISKLPHMIRPRGCMASLYHEDYVYVFGGVNYDDSKIILWIILLLI